MRAHSGTSVLLRIQKVITQKKPIELAFNRKNYPAPCWNTPHLINQVSREQNMRNNQTPLTLKTMSSIPPIAAQPTPQVFESSMGTRNNEPNSDFTIRVPHKLLNLKFVALFPTIKSALSGTLRDDVLNLTLTWTILEYPEFVATDYEKFIFTIEATLDAGVDQPITVQALCYVFVHMIKEEANLVFRVAALPDPQFSPDDKIIRAIFKSKRDEFQQQIDNILGLFTVSTALPDLFPPMGALSRKNYPRGFSPIESAFEANLLNSLRQPAASDQGTELDILTESYEVTHSREDISRIQISHRLLLDIMNSVFWDPLNKEFSKEEATIKLEHYTLNLVGDELELFITLSGRIKKDVPILPDPEWWINFKSPLILRLKVAPAPNNEIRIQYSTVYYPHLSVEPYNGAADAYEFLIPGLEFKITEMVRSGLTSEIKELVTGIDEPLYKIQPFTYILNNTPIMVTPKILDISSTTAKLTFIADFNITV